MDVNFHEEDWARIERDWSAWWHGDLDRPMVWLTVEDPLKRAALEAPGYVTNLPNEMPLDEVVDRYQAQIEGTRFYGDSFPKWWLNFGPG
jgi:hypothetical protein